jgi:hypothetical protein
VTENEHAHRERGGTKDADWRLARWFLDLVDDAIRQACEELGHGEGCGHGLPEKPVPPGQAAAPVTVLAATVGPLAVAALQAPYAAPDQPPPAHVIWQDSDGEVLVHLGQTMVRMFPGLILVALTLETDETGPGQLVVPFAVGGPNSPAGLVAVTERRPRGPVTLVDRWGQAAMAAAWQAVLDVVHGMALQSGVDAEGARLIPGAINTDGATLSVVPQARHPADQVAGR